MSKKTTYIHIENNNKILSSNEVRLYVPPEPEKMKVLIWGKELCSGAEWYDFLKCVEDKTKEIDQLKQQLAEKDKEIELLKHLGNHEITVEMFKENTKLIIEKRQFAISELEKVKDNLYELYNEPNNNGRGNFWNSIDVIDIIDQQIKKLKGEKEWKKKLKQEIL